MSGATKRKQKNVSIETKLEALKRLDKGETLNKVALDLGVGRQTVGDWKKKRSEIESWCAKRPNYNELDQRKSMKSGEHEKVSEALNIWFLNQRAKGTPITGLLLQEKAAQFYQQLKSEDEPEFSASVGWLDRWKKRYGVKQMTVSGEILSANKENYREFKESFHKLIDKEGVSGEQIFNCDETGLNYRMMPTKTLAHVQEISTPGYKRSKERITILACSNVTGDHKLKLAVIGKSEKPRAFKHVKKYSTKGETYFYDLPVWYRHQKSAWMNKVIFKEWFFDQFIPSVETYLKSKNLPRKALLILDNCSAHVNADELRDKEIKTVFLPANVTSLCQPMDRGVIAAMKKKYRSKLLSSLILAIDSGEDLMDKLKNIDLLDVIGWISKCWDEVKPISIVRSWRKLLDHSGNEFPEEKNENDDSDLLVTLMRKIPGLQEASSTDVNDWMERDEIDLTDNEIVAALKDCEENDEDKEPEEEENASKISHSDGLTAIKSSLRYFEEQGASAGDLLFLRRLCDQAQRNRNESERQTKITNFFSK